MKHWLASLIEQWRRGRPSKGDREMFWRKEIGLRVGTLTFEEITQTEKAVRDQL